MQGFRGVLESGLAFEGFAALGLGLRVDIPI